MSSEATASLRVVVLTSGGPYAENVLLSLGLAGVVPEAVAVAPLPARPMGVVLRHALRTRGLAGTLATVAARALTRFGGEGGDPWSGLARRVVHVGTLNSPDMVAALAELRPDWLVLAGTGIVKPEVLAVPTAGTLNAHPGLLPYLRGVGVVEHAILRGWPVGVTVHRVDAGIDTGPVFRRRLVPVSSSDSLSSLRRKADRLGIALLAEATSRLVAGGSFAETAQEARHPYCRWPSVAEKEQAERYVREGRASALYAAARAAAGGDEISAHFQPLAADHA